MNLACLHLHWTAKKKNGKEYRTYSLARSVRNGLKVRKKIVYKLGNLSAEEICQWKKLLNNAKNGTDPGETLASNMNETNQSIKNLIDESLKKRFAYDEVDRIADIENFKKIIQATLGDIIDPREQDNLRYPFYEILLIILGATLAGAKSIKGIHEYCKEKAPIFCSLLDMQQIPSYTSFWWLLTRASCSALNKLFTKWLSAIAESLPIKSEKTIGIDGKALRGAKNKPVHYVSAYDNNRGLLLGQEKVQEKSNEITAVPELLKVIDVKDAIVTIDAMGCQKEIARDIRERGGHYALALKGNQGTLHDEAKNFFAQARAVKYEDVKCSRITTVNKGHGREEIREITVTQNLEWLECRSEWQDLQGLVEIKSTRTVKGKTTEECRYYITSKNMKAKEAGVTIRSHWGIENQLHWVLDVYFDDDKSRANTGYAAENLGLFRRMAYCLLKQDTVKGQGLASQQRKAMWNDTYVLELLSRYVQQAALFQGIEVSGS